MSLGRMTALLLVIAAGGIGSLPARAPARVLPVLFVGRARGTMSGEGDPAQTRAFGLVLQNLSPADRLAFAESLGTLATRMEAYALPLGIDLENTDPRVDLWNLIGAHLPQLTAAKWLASGQWSTQDGAVGARLAKDCNAPHTPDERCIPLRSQTSTPEEKRARFAAWPLVHAVWLRVPASGEARVLATLRRLAHQKMGTVALVLTRNDLLAAPRGAASEELRNHAARIARLLRRAGMPKLPVLDAWAQSAPSGPLVPGLELQPHEILIVPRLGALTRLDQFGADLSTTLATALAQQDVTDYFAQPK